MIERYKIRTRGIRRRNTILVNYETDAGNNKKMADKNSMNLPSI
jgi:hypothetical protein